MMYNTASNWTEAKDTFTSTNKQPSQLMRLKKTRPQYKGYIRSG